MRKHVLVLFFAALLVGGCATINTLQPGTGSTFEVYGKGYDDIWKAAVEVTTRSLTIVEHNKEGGVIKAEARAGMSTWGEVVGVFITPTRDGEQKYTVEVSSMKRMQTQITGQNWEPTILAGIKAELNI